MVSIPKIIHQTYKSFDTIPAHWSHVPDSWKKHHPEWEYKFWSDKDIYDFIDNNYSSYAEFFRALPHHIQRVDMVRYFILYHYGGLYSDLDIEALGNIDFVFSDVHKNNGGSVYLIRSPNGRYFTNMFMASQPKHRFWLQVIDEIVDRVQHNKFGWMVDKHLIVLNTTGPGMLDDVVQQTTKENIVLLPLPTSTPRSVV